MEYTGYTPDKIKADKQKNTIELILLNIPMLLGLLLLVGTIVSILSIEVTDVNTISYDEMEERHEYYFSEMVLIDSYAKTENSVTGYVSDRYYIVRFMDNDRDWVYASIKPEGWSELSNKCEAYLEDDSLTIGDVILSGCFHGYEHGDTVNRYFEEAYDLFSIETPGVLLNWTFYSDDIETMEAYREDEISNQMPGLFIAAVFIIPSVIGILILVHKRKELNKYLSECTEPYGA